MKTFKKIAISLVLAAMSLSVYSQDARLESIFNKNKIRFQYEKEALRYLVGYQLKNKRAQLVKITAFHTIGNIDVITISTMVRSSKLKGNELENWVTNQNKKAKKGKFSIIKDFVQFEIEIPVKSSDKELLEAIKKVADVGDKVEQELSEGDTF